MSTEFVKKRDTVDLDALIPEKCQVIFELRVQIITPGPNGQPQQGFQNCVMMCNGKPENVRTSIYDVSSECFVCTGYTFDANTGMVDATLRTMIFPKDIVKLVVVQPPPSGLSLAKAGQMGAMH